ncbi:predicted protein [Plenodomus lingam JN3]|uniref:Predicted protein n=1 Tax=Leptosphaeria maculans (strain JN3 / isolate v23.1.3 / race Av1-4-5-6-7-8) TaxID=985895 RepID=E5R4Q1_LEPMJ|nr:predicted protein [Plenodomus lingam JN3]CBX92174.1 predicted protein [Plenodomus lingam JN3]
MRPLSPFRQRLTRHRGRQEGLRHAGMPRGRRHVIPMRSWACMPPCVSHARYCPRG